MNGCGGILLAGRHVGTYYSCVFAIMRQLIISRIVSDFFLTVLPRAFHEKDGRCQAFKDILWSGGWARSHKSEGRTCARIKCAAAATKSALSRACLPSRSSAMSSNPVRIPCPLSSRHSQSVRWWWVVARVFPAGEPEIRISHWHSVFGLLNEKFPEMAARAGFTESQSG